MEANTLPRISISTVRIVESRGISLLHIPLNKMAW
eukprot:Gb_37064 [translate_table: standard]